jgi:hypothetical protein
MSSYVVIGGGGDHGGSSTNSSSMTKHKPPAALTPWMVHRLGGSCRRHNAVGGRA